MPQEILLHFERAKESKNWSVFKETGGFNQLYLSKDLPDQVVVKVMVKEAK